MEYYRKKGGVPKREGRKTMGRECRIPKRGLKYHQYGRRGLGVGVRVREGYNISVRGGLG